MNVVDSSGWLEYFAGSELAEVFSPAIEDLQSLLVPSISIFEVHKRLLLQQGLAHAQRAIEVMKRGSVVPLSTEIAIEATHFSIDLKLPMADSIIYATADINDATIWTTDKHFKGLSRVEYRMK